IAVSKMKVWNTVSGRGDGRYFDRVNQLESSRNVFPSLGLCTTNTSWALIERPYSLSTQPVGAVYDRPRFFVQSPSLDRRGGCASRKCCEATFESADGVVILD